MVERRVTDGRRIAELLASEVRGRLDDRAVVDTHGVEGGGEFAYGVDGADGTRVADVYVHDSHVRLVVHERPNAVADAAREAGLPVETGTAPSRAVVRVESGAAVKRASDLLAA